MFIVERITDIAIIN